MNTDMQYTDIIGVKYNVYFKCPTCDCKRFQRPSYYLMPLTFLEGVYECSNCQEEFRYFDEAFTMIQAQLSLFDK